MKKIIAKKDVNLLLHNLSNNFNLSYVRVSPKCHRCNLANKEWKALNLTHCPRCGQKLELINNVEIQSGYFLCNGDLYEYFDAKLQDFRKCRVDHIVYIKSNENEWFVF